MNKFTTDSTTKEIKNILIKLGFTPNLKGYKYLCTAINLTLNDTNLINNVTKQLYPTIALLHGDKPSCIERSIRHAIKVSYNSKKLFEINNVFACTILTPKEKPTCSQLISLLVEKVFINQL